MGQSSKAGLKSLRTLFKNRFHAAACFPPSIYRGRSHQLLRVLSFRRNFGAQWQHAGIRRDGHVQVYPSDHSQGALHPGVSHRGVEGDIREGGPQLLVPDFPLPAAGRRNDIHTDKAKGKRLQMVR